MDSGKSSNSALPNYFEYLSSSDKQEYHKLRESICVGRNRRGKRLEAFSDMLAAVKKYAVRMDEDDWKRCIVCGVYWVDNGIAINTRQLQLLIGKCKSSINGSLHRIGYNPSATPGDVNSSLLEKIPILKGNFSELRQWTIRQQSVCTPQPKSFRDFYAVQLQPLMSPEARVPSADMFIQSQRFMNFKESDKNNDEMYNDPFCLPVDDWNDGDHTFGDDYDLYEPQS